MNKSFIIIYLGTFFYFLSPARAGELLLSPDLMDGKSVQISLYGRSAETEPVIRLSDVNSISVPTSGGSSTIFSRSNADIKMTSNADAVIASLAIRPRDGLAYRFKMGQVTNFDLEFSSASLSNKLSQTHDGLVWGAGVRWNATQGTLVSSAINLDFGYTQTVVNLNRFQSNGVVSSVNERFKQQEFQAAFSISKRWRFFEPYLGLKVFRVLSRLQDNDTKSRVKGKMDGLSPLLGMKFEIFEREYILLEASFVDEKALNAGMAIRF